MLNDLSHKLESDLLTNELCKELLFTLVDDYIPYREKEDSLEANLNKNTSVH